MSGEHIEARERTDQWRRHRLTPQPAWGVDLGAGDRSEGVVRNCHARLREDRSASAHEAGNPQARDVIGERGSLFELPLAPQVQRLRWLSSSLDGLLPSEPALTTRSIGCPARFVRSRSGTRQAWVYLGSGSG